MWYRDFYPRSQPRQAKGGIKAQTKQGQFGKSWWAKRWIAVLESFDIGARLGRGRSYARKGQVLSINVGKGTVSAKVQGSRPTPYEVSIKLDRLTDKDWDSLLQALSGQALFVARLLSGEMPQDIEKVFDQAGLSLFPRRHADLKTSCSCPDSSNPCKHIAALYYLLGEEFDRDPFLLFQLRGLSRDELLARLNALAQPIAAAETASENVAVEPEKEPLPLSPDVFWAMGSLPDDLYGDVEVPRESAAWPRRLGSFPFWRGDERFLDALQMVYKAAAREGLSTFLGEGRENP
jgi:uncharacterized Zn finger protein